LIPSKRERVEEVLRRLERLPPCPTGQAAREQLANALNEVEDELTPFPYDPADLDPDNRRKATDRMYPVQDDNVNDVAGHPKVKQLTSAGEQVFIGENGAIEIRSKRRADGSLAVPATTGQLLLARPGLDGRGVWDLSRPQDA
jgi:hypothetical protein